VKTEYIPELSEERMVRRAPERPYPLQGEDARYVETALRGVEAAFGLAAFPGVPFAAIPGRLLIRQCIDWWRALEPASDVQREAHARLPGAIRLLDTHSVMLAELEAARRQRAAPREEL